jgi:hypothetical protein
MFRSAALAIAMLLATAFTASLAQQPSAAQFLTSLQGTPQEQAACRPDVMKLCRNALPDVFRVLSCLQSNRTKLRRTCREVLESHGQ